MSDDAPVTDLTHTGWNLRQVLPDDKDGGGSGFVAQALLSTGPCA